MTTETFLEMIIPEPNSGCWLWTGAVSGCGYGSVSFHGKSYSAHRLSFEVHNGRIPYGKFVLHKCDNKQCVNPCHLYLGDHRKNISDAIARKRYRQLTQTHCKHGHALANAPIQKRADGRERRVCVECRRASGKRHYERNK